MAADWLAEFSRQYFVDVVDYHRASGGLLIAGGRDAMRVVMAGASAMRWCADLGRVRNTSRLARWACWASHFATPVAIAGWFNNCELLGEVVASLPKRPLAYTPGISLGAQHVASLDELIAACSGTST